MHAIPTPGGPAHVSLIGPEASPVLVFSNSLGTDFRVWDPLLPLLPQGVRILRYDTRGHGLSACPPGPWSIADMADDLAAILTALGLGPVVLCGLSVGGLIAQSLAARHGGLLSGMILMDTSAKIGTVEIWNERIADLEARGLDAMADAIMERWFTEGFRASRPGDLALWRQMAARTPQAGYERVCAAIRDADLTESTSALTLPTLALCGDSDLATPPETVEATAALIAGAEYRAIADAGHLPCVEQPEATAQAITHFLRGRLAWPV